MILNVILFPFIKMRKYTKYLLNSELSERCERIKRYTKEYKLS